MLRSRPNVGVVLTVAALVCVLCVVVLKRPSLVPGTTICEQAPQPVYTKPVYLRSIDTKGDEKTLTLQDTLKDQRDRLSKELTAMRQKLGRMDCEVLSLSLSL